MDGSISIPINSEKPTSFPDLLYIAGRLQEQPSSPLPLCPPTAHPLFTTKLPPKVVVVGISEIELEFIARGPLDTPERDRQPKLCPLREI